MMLSGFISSDVGSLSCLIGIERKRVLVVVEDDLTRFWWPVSHVELDETKTGMRLRSEQETFAFVADMPERFRWIMPAALQDALARRSRWWRIHKTSAIGGLSDKLRLESTAA